MSIILYPKRSHRHAIPVEAIPTQTHPITIRNDSNLVQEEGLEPLRVAPCAFGRSQRKARELLGGGPRAFQKYEAGTQAVSSPLSHLSRC